MSETTQTSHHRTNLNWADRHRDAAAVATPWRCDFGSRSLESFRYDERSLRHSIIIKPFRQKWEKYLKKIICNIFYFFSAGSALFPLRPDRWSRGGRGDGATQSRGEIKASFVVFFGIFVCCPLAAIKWAHRNFVFSFHIFFFTTRAHIIFGFWCVRLDRLKLTHKRYFGCSSNNDFEVLKSLNSLFCTSWKWTLCRRSFLNWIYLQFIRRAGNERETTTCQTFYRCRLVDLIWIDN